VGLNTRTRWLALLGVSAALLIALLLFIPELLPSLLGSLRSDFRNALTRPYFHIGALPITPAFLVKAALFLLALGIASGAIRRFLWLRVLIRTSLDEGQRYAFAHIAGYIVYLFGLLVGLQLVGLNLSNLVLLGSAIGIGLGFGLQNIANNFVSGIIILTERPIRVGDRVEVGGTNGDVIRIGSRSTWVRTNENVVIIIPNSEFINNRVTNWTVNDRQVRFAFPVGVSYGSDPERVRKILAEVALRHPDVLEDPYPEVLFAGFGDSSLDFQLRVWTIRRVQTPLVLGSELYYAIFAAFRQHGIEIPFPQRDLHLKTVSSSVRVTHDGHGNTESPSG
jgi:small-conductance mechanosensitive channel